MAIDTNFLLQAIVPDVIGSAKAGFDLGTTIRNAPLLRQMNEQKAAQNEQVIAQGNVDAGSEMGKAAYSLLGDTQVTAENYPQVMSQFQKLGFALQDDDFEVSEQNLSDLQGLVNYGKGLQQGTGKQFADSTAFTTTVDEEGNPVQGFAVREQGGKAYFQPIGGSVKEMPQDKRDRDLQSKKDLESFKTSQDLAKLINREEKTTTGQLDKEKAVLEGIERNSAKEAELMEGRNALNLINRMKSGKLGSIYGRGEAVYPELMRSQEGIDLIADRNQMVSLLKLASRAKLKGQGSVSDSDAKTLSDSATILGNANISDEAAARELERITPLFENIVNTIESNKPKTKGAPNTQQSEMSAADKLKEAKAKAGL